MAFWVWKKVLVFAARIWLLTIMSLRRIVGVRKLDTGTSESAELELSAPEDVRSVQTFLLYLRHMPVTYIERAQNISRRTVYRDLDRARTIFRLDENFSRDLFFETSESLREAWQNYQNADNQLRNASVEVEARTGLEIQKSTYLGMIDKMLRTRIEAAKLLIPKSESVTVTTLPTPEGPATQIVVKRDTRPVGEIFKQLEKEEVKKT